LENILAKGHASLVFGALLVFKRTCSATCVYRKLVLLALYGKPRHACLKNLQAALRSEHLSQKEYDSFLGDRQQSSTLDHLSSEPLSPLAEK
jgi:hypothetical protein